MRSPAVLISIGAMLAVIGAWFWTLPKRSAFVARHRHAARLRASGEDVRAARLEEETQALSRWIRILGQALVGIGTVVVVTGLLIAR